MKKKNSGVFTGLKLLALLTAAYIVLSFARTQAPLVSVASTNKYNLIARETLGPHPELSINTVSRDLAGGKFVVSYCNTGAGYSTLLMAVGLTSNGTDQSQVNTNSAVPQAGACASVTFPRTQFGSSCYEGKNFTATVDALGIITEDNEANNSKQVVLPNLPEAPTNMNLTCTKNAAGNIVVGLSWGGSVYASSYTVRIDDTTTALNPDFTQAGLNQVTYSMENNGLAGRKLSASVQGLNASGGGPVGIFPQQPTCPTRVPPTYTITAQPVCSNGATPAGKYSLEYIVWPPNPATRVYDAYATGNHTLSKQLTLPAGDTQNLYVAFHSQTANSQPLNAMQPIGTPPNTGITYVKSWTDNNWNAVIPNTVPSGSYTIKYDAPAADCALPVSYKWDASCQNISFTTTNSPLSGSDFSLSAYRATNAGGIAWFTNKFAITATPSGTKTYTIPFNGSPPYPFSDIYPTSGTYTLTLFNGNTSVQIGQGTKTLTCPASTPFKKIAPAVNSTLPFASNTFSWAQYKGSVVFGKYVLEITNTSGTPIFRRTITSQTTTSTNINFDLPIQGDEVLGQFQAGTKYNWEVYMVNGNVKDGADDNVLWSFTIAGTAPGSINCDNSTRSWKINSVTPRYTNGKVGFVLDGTFTNISNCGLRTVNGASSPNMVYTTLFNQPPQNGASYAYSAVTATDTKITIPATSAFVDGSKWRIGVYFCNGTINTAGACLNPPGYSSVFIDNVVIHYASDNEPVVPGCASDEAVMVVNTCAFSASASNTYAYYDLTNVRDTVTKAYLDVKKTTGTTPYGGNIAVGYRVPKGSCDPSAIGSGTFDPIGVTVTDTNLQYVDVSSAVNRHPGEAISVQTYNNSEYGIDHSMHLCLKLKVSVTPPPTCLCQSNNFCDSTCSFKGVSNAASYSCARPAPVNHYTSDPTQQNKNVWCQRYERSLGYAGRSTDSPNTNPNLIDYGYYVQLINGGTIPPYVNPDFNGNGQVEVGDRDIIIQNLP